MKSNVKSELKLKRKRRIRKKITGTAERPRLSVFRTAKHVYCQVINDVTSTTILSASSFEKGNKLSSANKTVCEEVGKTLAKRCKEKNIGKVVFDKNGNLYHGRIKAIADGARAEGLIF